MHAGGKSLNFEWPYRPGGTLPVFSDRVVHHSDTDQLSSFVHSRNLISPGYFMQMHCLQFSN